MGELEALAAFAVAALVTVVLTPVTIVLARRIGALAQPSDRGLHERPIPYLGGLALLAGVLAGALAFLAGDPEVRAILVGCVVMTTIGILDDALELPARGKLAGQVAAALIPALGGVVVDGVTLPLVGAVDFGIASVPLTVLGIVAVMNVVNFSDGVDGLAAGVGAIAALTFAVIALSFGRDNAGALAAVSAGACIGFLPHNFNPARTFMGDSGSNTLGLLLACVAVLGLLKTTAIIALLLPLVLLAVPILDTGFVVARRIKNRLPIYMPDRTHFHHRMASIGFSQRRTVLYLYAWSGSLAALALALRFVPAREDGVIQPPWLVALIAFAALAAGASIYVVYLLELFRFGRLRRIQLRRGAGAGDELSPGAIDAEVAHELESGKFDAVENEDR